ncbi:hypothetical protein [Cytobacillus sp. IB215316]|uniref:hypothetical protein n=1 Tax=Cytobacillus sp. IB215316 TaxID=3097354 RepID=UPI002A14CDA7|nr:hypothetical protein [Cytobacillus sp. IB215316]MDX8362538.1 hypothetical protein [Cytobacillus sp. IB215316]
MKRPFNKLFLGFLFVLLDINIFIDILPDPLGYYLIYRGLKLLLSEFPESRKAVYLTILLCIVSIPSVFIQNFSNNPSWNMPLLSWWSVYYSVLEIMYLILVYYVFQLMIKIVQQFGDKLLILRTVRTFKIYFTIMITINIIRTFTINMTPNMFLFYNIAGGLIGITLQLIFLFLLKRFKSIDLMAQTS